MELQAQEREEARMMEWKQWRNELLEWNSFALDGPLAYNPLIHQINASRRSPIQINFQLILIQLLAFCVIWLNSLYFVEVLWIMIQYHYTILLKYSSMIDWYYLIEVILIALN